MNRNLYGILMKYPAPGRVKTRLAREIGAEEAAELYRVVTGRIMENTHPGDSGYERIIFYTPEDMKDEFRNWFPGETLLPQKGDDIGEIMANSLRDLFDRGAAKAVITGSDIPRLDREVVGRAFRELDCADVAIGPASDGGYYLIGMKSLHEDVFRGISWGSAMVCRQTLSAISGLDLSYRTVLTLSDLDTAEDLREMESFLHSDLE
jgi:rSAM/selenodomain-associated transferase 1